MEITYTCTNRDGMSDIDSWHGVIRIISLDSPCEIEVRARGSSLHVLLGSHAYGNFICIPNWDIGCELASLSDSFWNLERLCNAGLRVVDAISVVDAFVALSDYTSL